MWQVLERVVTTPLICGLQASLTSANLKIQTPEIGDGETKQVPTTADGSPNLTDLCKHDW
jgi:hypothetical protein